MTNKQIAVSRTGAKAAYLIERWKRGVGLMLLLALTVAAAVIVVGIPMVVIGEVVDHPAWSSPRNIGIAAMILTLPFYLTHGAFLCVIDAVTKGLRREP